MRCIFTNRTIGIGCFSIGTNRTIGTNGPSVWRIVSVCVYWTCVTVPRAQVSAHRGRVFFEVIRLQITNLKWSQAQVHFFQWFIWNMSCLSHYGLALLRFWFQTDLRRENSASFLKIQAGKTFSYHGHALVTLYVQFLCSDWSKFDRWVHTENLCSILKVVYFDSWGWQRF